MVSNRNIDSDRQYELYQKNVEAKGKSRNNDAMEKAVDNATKDTDGEYMMNVAIYVKRKGRKVKVIGDVYGVAKSDTITGH